MNNTSIQLQRIDGVSILTIGNEIIRITDYEIKSSASGLPKQSDKIQTHLFGNPASIVLRL